MSIETFEYRVSEVKVVRSNDLDYNRQGKAVYTDAYARYNKVWKLLMGFAQKGYLVSYEEYMVEGKLYCRAVVKGERRKNGRTGKGKRNTSRRRGD